MNDNFKTYLFEYDHDGARWGFEIVASSIEDAEARVQRLPWARYVGELKATIPAPFGIVARVLCWFHNLMR
jgi:hypothetical protein